MVNYTVIMYLLYLVITLSLTLWVGRMLFRNGRVFLMDIFAGDATLTDSVNKLLLVGFYLVNIGYTVLCLRDRNLLTDLQTMMETLSVKSGTIILVLGGMHFLNLYILYTLRKRAKTEQHLGKYGIPPRA